MVRKIYRQALTFSAAYDTLELARKFVELETDTPKLFYVWGHSYEFDFDNNWEQIEASLRFISGREDIIYGTNREVLEPLFY